MSSSPDIRKRYAKIPRGDMWDLDHTFTCFILPRLEKFRKLEAGHPCGLTAKRWYKILDEMIAGFRLMYDDKGPQYGTKAYAVRDAKIKRGLLLFSRWYGSLWT